MRLPITPVPAVDLVFAFVVFVVVFTGNAKVFGLPLNFVLPVTIALYYRQFRADIWEWVAVLASAAIFYVYAVTLDVDYAPSYPLWVINFLSCYLMVVTLNQRLRSWPENVFLAMFYASLLLLFIFALPMVTGSNENRATMIFGPNMLYRVIAFLITVAAGYLFSTGRMVTAVCASIFGFYLILLTGSRGAFLSIGVVGVALLHCYTKRLSFNKLPGFMVVICLLGLLPYLIDFQSFRTFNFTAFEDGLDGNYLDAYIRFRPYFYFLYEPDRLSMIGISYETWLSHFYVEGFSYPHSLVLELIMFYGIFGSIFLLFLISRILIVARALLSTPISPGHVFYYSFFAFGAGTLVSGDMGDNGGFLGIVMAMNVKAMLGLRSNSAAHTT